MVNSESPLICYPSEKSSSYKSSSFPKFRMFHQFSSFEFVSHLCGRLQAHPHMRLLLTVQIGQNKKPWVDIALIQCSVIIEHPQVFRWKSVHDEIKIVNTEHFSIWKVFSVHYFDFIMNTFSSEHLWVFSVHLGEKYSTPSEILLERFWNTLLNTKHLTFDSTATEA